MPFKTRSSLPLLVPGIGLEPISLSARASKTLVSANFTTRAQCRFRFQTGDFGLQGASGKSQESHRATPKRSPIFAYVSR